MPTLTADPGAILTAPLIPISEGEFWDWVNELPPLLRLGYRDGPGAFLTGEPWDERRCTITGEPDYTYEAVLVLKNADEEPEWFKHPQYLTLHEFKALTDKLMPGVEVCGGGYGAQLLDADNNLRPYVPPMRRHR